MNQRPRLPMMLLAVPFVLLFLNNCCFLWFCTDEPGEGAPARYFFPLQKGKTWEYLSRSHFISPDTAYCNSTFVEWSVQEQLQVIEGEPCHVIHSVEEGIAPDTASAAYHHEPGEGLYLWAVDPDFTGQPMLKGGQSITRLEKVLLISENTTRDTAWTTGAQGRELEKELRTLVRGQDTLFMVVTRFRDELISTDYFSRRGLEKRVFPVVSFYDADAGDTVTVRDSLVLLEVLEK